MSEEDIIKILTRIPKVGESTAQKLVSAGYDSYDAIANATPEELSNAAKISPKLAESIIVAAMTLVGTGFITGKEYYQKRQNTLRITTGSKKVDMLIGGGIETGTITEIFGVFGSGKSQMAHQLAVNVQLPEEQGGLGAGAIYIDTEITFRPERILQMASALGLDTDSVLENILVARADSVERQILLLKNVQDILTKKQIGLLVIDSLMAHFRAEYPGRNVLAERQQRLKSYLHILSQLVEKHPLAILITNQVMETPDVVFGDPVRPVGGHVLAHVPHTRIYLRKAKYPRRIARLVDSPYLPEGEVIFQITSEGIRDIAEDSE